MDPNIYCINHPNKFAKRHCKQCVQNLCSSCALDYHCNHIEQVTSLNSLYITKNPDFINNFVQDLEYNMINKTRCMYVVFHEPTNYCKNCQKFICQDCCKTHKEKFYDHEIIDKAAFNRKITTKASLLNRIIKFQNKDFILEDSNYLTLTNSIFSNIQHFKDHLITPLFSLKENLESSFKLIKNLNENLYQRIFEFYRKNQKRMLYDQKLITEFINDYEKLSKETDENQLLTTLIKFDSLLNDLIGDEEAKYYKILINEQKNIELMLKENFELLEKLYDQFSSKIDAELLYFNANISAINHKIRDFLKSNIKLTPLEIEDLVKHCKRETNYFNQQEINSKNKILAEEVGKRYENMYNYNPITLINQMNHANNVNQYNNNVNNFNNNNNSHFNNQNYNPQYSQYSTHSQNQHQNQNPNQIILNPTYNSLLRQDPRFNRIEKEIALSENVFTVASKKTSVKSQLTSKAHENYFTYDYSYPNYINEKPSKKHLGGREMMKFIVEENEHLIEKEEVNLSEYAGNNTNYFGNKFNLEKLNTLMSREEEQSHLNENEEINEREIDIGLIEEEKSQFDEQNSNSRIIEPATFLHEHQSASELYIPSRKLLLLSDTQTGHSNRSASNTNLGERKGNNSVNNNKVYPYTSSNSNHSKAKNIFYCKHLNVESKNEKEERSNTYRKKQLREKNNKPSSKLFGTNSVNANINDSQSEQQENILSNKYDYSSKIKTKYESGELNLASVNDSNLPETEILVEQYNDSEKPHIEIETENENERIIVEEKISNIDNRITSFNLSNFPNYNYNSSINNTNNKLFFSRLPSNYLEYLNQNSHSQIESYPTALTMRASSTSNINNKFFLNTNRSVSDLYGNVPQLIQLYNKNNQINNKEKNKNVYNTQVDLVSLPKRTKSETVFSKGMFMNKSAKRFKNFNYTSKISSKPNFTLKNKLGKNNHRKTSDKLSKLSKFSKSKSTDTQKSESGKNNFNHEQTFDQEDWTTPVCRQKQISKTLELTNNINKINYNNIIAKPSSSIADSEKNQSFNLNFEFNNSNFNVGQTNKDQLIHDFIETSNKNQRILNRKYTDNRNKECLELRSRQKANTERSVNTNKSIISNTDSHLNFGSNFSNLKSTKSLQPNLIFRMQNRLGDKSNEGLIRVFDKNKSDKLYNRSNTNPINLNMEVNFFESERNNFDKNAFESIQESIQSPCEIIITTCENNDNNDNNNNNNDNKLNSKIDNKSKKINFNFSDSIDSNLKKSFRKKGSILSNSKNNPKNKNFLPIEAKRFNEEERMSSNRFSQRATIPIMQSLFSKDYMKIEENFSPRENNINSIGLVKHEQNLNTSSVRGIQYRDNEQESSFKDKVEKIKELERIFTCSSSAAKDLSNEELDIIYNSFIYKNLSNLELSYIESLFISNDYNILAFNHVLNKKVPLGNIRNISNQKNNYKYISLCQIDNIVLAAKENTENESSTELILITRLNPYDLSTLNTTDFQSNNTSVIKVFKLSDIIISKRLPGIKAIIHKNELFIFIIGGYKEKSCEIYNSTLKKTIKLPDLNTVRENPVVLINTNGNKFDVYAFFGNEIEIHKPVFTIEKLEIENFISIINNNTINSSNICSSWKIIEIEYQYYNFSCVLMSQNINSDDKVILFGDDENSNSTIRFEYDFKNKELTKKESLNTLVKFGYSTFNFNKSTNKYFNFCKNNGVCLYDDVVEKLTFIKDS